MIRINICNNTQKDRRVIVYQQNKTKRDYINFVWDSRLLSIQATWTFNFPVTCCQVAGIVGNYPDNYSLTNIANAEPGQLWTLKQERDNPFKIELLDKNDNDKIIKIKNSTKEKRTAVLAKNNVLLIGYKELPVDDVANFEVDPIIYLELSKEFKKGDVLENNNSDSNKIAKIEPPYIDTGIIVVVINEDKSSGKIDYKIKKFPNIPYCL
jgi:hypothetical protein